MADDIAYQQRIHPLAPNVSYTLSRASLAYEDERRRSGTIALKDVSRIRLSYDPARLRSVRHVLEIETGAGARLKLSSNTYAGMGSFKPRNAAFVAFLDPLVERARQANPAVRIETGRGTAPYVAYLAIYAVFLAAVAWGTVTFALAAQWVVAAGLALMLAYFGMVGVDYARNNLPRVITAGPYPRELVPQASENDV